MTNTERSIRDIKDAAKQAAVQYGIRFPVARRHLIRQIHKHLTANNIQRRLNGNKLGLRKRILMAENG